MAAKKENKEALAVDRYPVGWMLKKQSKLISDVIYHAKSPGSYSTSSPTVEK